jgi:hypothetical protein
MSSKPMRFGQFRCHDQRFGRQTAWPPVHEQPRTTRLADGAGLLSATCRIEALIISVSDSCTYGAAKPT